MGAVSPTYGSELSDLFLNTMNNVGEEQYNYHTYIPTSVTLSLV